MVQLLAALPVLTFAQEPSGIPILIWILLGIILLAIVLGLVLGSRTSEREEDINRRSSMGESPTAIPQTGGMVEEAPTATISDTDTGVRVYTTPADTDVTEMETPGIESSEGIDNAQDLTQIDGIGPGVQQILNGAGIYTFDQLARTSPDELRDIVRRSGLRADDLETWPEQAMLASEGRWEELRALKRRNSPG